MGDDHDRHDREKPSWSEIDKRRGQPRSSRPDHPRGHVARERSRQQTRAALAEADALFSRDKGGEQGAVLARAVREAHGSRALAGICRDYVAALGTPDATDLLAIFLDTDEADLMRPALERLLELRSAGRIQVKGGLAVQLRVLAQHPDDDVAGLAEDLLA
jgi:hypothetical protein